MSHCEPPTSTYALQKYDQETITRIGPDGQERTYTIIRIRPSKTMTTTIRERIGEAVGEIKFEQLDQSIYDQVSSVDVFRLVEQIEGAMPEGYSLDRSRDPVIGTRDVLVRARRPEGNVVFECDILGTVNPGAKQIDFKITCAGDVNASAAKFDQVAETLKQGLLANLRG